MLLAAPPRRFGAASAQASVTKREGAPEPGLFRGELRVCDPRGMMGRDQDQALVRSGGGGRRLSRARGALPPTWRQQRARDLGWLDAAAWPQQGAARGVLWQGSGPDPV